MFAIEARTKFNPSSGSKKKKTFLGPKQIHPPPPPKKNPNSAYLLAVKSRNELCEEYVQTLHYKSNTSVDDTSNIAEDDIEDTDS